MSVLPERMLSFPNTENHERCSQAHALMSDGSLRIPWDVGLKLEDHFSSMTKMIEPGQEARREIKDSFLSRDTCYVLAQNGDPEKP